VFDGYSFDSQLAVITDDDEDVSEEDDQEKEEDQDISSILAELTGTVTAETVVIAGHHEEPARESKTPEARATALPSSTSPSRQSSFIVKSKLPSVNTPQASATDHTPRASEESIPPTSRPPTSPVKAVAEAAAAASMGSDIHHKEHKKASSPKPHGQRSNRQRNRREKSGVPALDRDLSDANDEDEVRAECDEEDEDWDFLDAYGEDRNRARGNNLSARGAIDRYRLAVFRKGSTPSRVGPGATGDSERQFAAIDGPNSPSPIAKERRGLIGALPFRRAPKTFLRPQSPPSLLAQSPLSLRPLFRTASNATISTMQTLYTARTSLGQFSLKSKKSTFSVGSYRPSSHASTSSNAQAVYDADVVEVVGLPDVSADERRFTREASPGHSLEAEEGRRELLSFGSPE
jgi:hypothetical protein